MIKLFSDLFHIFLGILSFAHLYFSNDICTFQLPHPYLHEYLLNPTIPLSPGVRTLYTVLKSVLAKAVTKSESVAHFPMKMLSCRKKLLGDRKSAPVKKEVEMTPEEVALMEAILVLDEFCKELAAVTFVKYQCFA